MNRPTAGAALVTVVLITLALYAIGHGLLALALGELAASHAGARQLEARVAAESAIRWVLAPPGAPWMDSVPIGGRRQVVGRTLGRARAEATAERLSPEAWWLEGVGTAGGARSRTAHLAWALDPAARVGSLEAVLTVGADAPVSLFGPVSAATPLAVDAPLGPGGCDPWANALAARYAADPPDVLAALTPEDTVLRLGSLDLPELLQRASVHVTGTGAPGPVERAGRCDEADPWSWGDPDRPWRPCGSTFVLRGAPGGLYVAGGVGQGVLVVDGDLVLRDGARFYGMALATGSLRVEGGGHFVGMAVAIGGAHVGSDGAVQGSACWAARALAARRSDLGGLRLVEGGSLGSF